jgi:hypothetical protein
MITSAAAGRFLDGRGRDASWGSHNGGITVFKRKGIVVYSGAPPILFGGVRGRGIFDEEGRASKLRDIFK